MLTKLKSKASNGFFLQACAHKELRNAKEPQLQSKHRTKHSYASELSQRPPTTSRVPSKVKPLATASHPSYGFTGGLTTSSKRGLDQNGDGLLAFHFLTCGHAG